MDMARWARWLIGEAERAGAHVFDNHKVQGGPIIENGFVSGVRVLKPDGSTEEFRAKVVIDASGVGASLGAGYHVSGGFPSHYSLRTSQMPIERLSRLIMILRSQST